VSTVRFQAISVGIDVPTHCFNGTVHSLFRQACNVRIEPHRLLTLLSSEKGNVPHGIRLKTSSQSAFLDLLQVGQPVACRGGILRIGGALSMDLRDAPLWHIDLKELPIDLRRPDQTLSWAAAWSELRASHHTIGLPEIMHAVSLPGEQCGSSAVPSATLEWSTRTIPAFLRAIRDFRLDDAMTAMGSVIGLGPGLTPSGDDFLVGYLAGLWCKAGNSPPRMRFLTALGSELFQAARRTNDISCAYLRSAAKGHVSEPLATLAQQLNRADDLVRLRTATQAALHIGHTSGTDGVLGLLLGCLAWQDRPPRIPRDAHSPVLRYFDAGYRSRVET
jgi:hypothetical protein